MNDWIAELTGVLEAGGRTALVTVVATQGSTPRKAGTKMIVTETGIAGTIGGGQLEYVAIQKARDLLSSGGGPALETFPLGPQLGQCCGGSAQLLFEALDGAALAWLTRAAEPLEAAEPAVLLTGGGDPGKQVLSGTELRESTLAGRLSAERSVLVHEEADGGFWVAEWLHRPAQPLFLFGAGHVGRALVTALAPLPFRVTWVDSRAEAFPPDLPANATAELCEPQRYAVERAPADCHFLVMTHSHAIDFEVCEAVLRRGDAAYLGLIGSRSKRARFLSRLTARGLPAERLECPIGVPGIGGNEPAVIAASVAADLLRRAEALQLAAREAAESAWSSTAAR